MQSQGITNSNSQNIFVSVHLTGSKLLPHIFTVNRSLYLSTFVKVILSQCPDLESIKEETHVATLVFSELECDYNIHKWEDFSFDTHLQHLRFEFIELTKFYLA